MDDLNDLRAALKAAPPAPDPEARARALALAMENFDRARAARPADPSLADGGAGGFAGLGLRLRALMARPALATTTSVAAVALGAAVILPLMEVPQRDRAILTAPPAEAVFPAAEAPMPAPVARGDAGAGYASSAAQADAAAGEVRRAAEDEIASAPLAELAPPAPEMSRRAARAAEPAPEAEPAPQAEEAREALPEQASDLTAAMDGMISGAEAPLTSLTLAPGQGGWDSLASGLELGYWPGPGQVSTGALINAFDYATNPPAAGETFASAVGVQPAPWDAARQLVSITLTGRAGRDDAAPGLLLEWNPERVASYRLLGQDSRMTSDDSLQMTAVYELVPAAQAVSPEGDLGVLRLEEAGGDPARPLWERAITGRETAGLDQRFIAAIAGFALILQSDAATRGWSLAAAADLAEAALGTDPTGARAEALRLIRLADSQPD